MYDYIIEREDFSIFKITSDDVQLSETLKKNTGLTVFLLINQAFQKLHINESNILDFENFGEISK